MGAFSVYDPYYGKNICAEVNLQALRLIAISSWNNIGHTKKCISISLKFD